MTAAPAGALETLGRSTAFLRRLLDGMLTPASQAAPIPPRVVGNILAEFDRFLHLSLDDLTPVARGASPARSRHAGGRLTALRGSPARPDPDNVRLRALGRSVACLRHCAGRARRGDRRGDRSMTLGWPSRGEALRVVALGTPIHPSASDLRDVCAFYERLAAELAAMSRGRGEARVAA